MPPKGFIPPAGLAWQPGPAGTSAVGTTGQAPWVKMLNLESNWDDELLQRLIPSFGWKGDLPNAKAVTEHGKKVGSDGQLAVHARLRRQAMRLPHATVVAHMFKLPVCLSDAKVHQRWKCRKREPTTRTGACRHTHAVSFTHTHTHTHTHTQLSFLHSMRLLLTH